MNEEILAKRYTERFKNHEPLYNLLREEGNDAYESVKHCYRVEIELIGEKIISESSKIAKKKRTMYNQIIIPFSEAMLSLEELLEIDYTDLKNEMKKEMENLL